MELRSLIRHNSKYFRNNLSILSTCDNYFPACDVVSFL